MQRLATLFLSRSGSLFSVTLIVGLLLATTLIVSAHTSDQTTLLELDIENTSIENIIREIRAQSGLTFLYRTDLLADVPPLSIKAKAIRVEEALNRLLHPYGFMYEIYDSTVVIRRQVADDQAEPPPPFTVAGTVSDTETEGALPGVNVLVKGSSVGTVTDIDGHYTIQAGEASDTLVFSSVGYLTEEEPIRGRSTIDMPMVTDIQSLAEVVIVGYGSQEKKNLTNAVSTVEQDDFQSGAFNNPLQMIQGKVPGVRITSAGSADPNQGAGVSVRGASSISAGNGPLIVIDGMPGGDLRNIAQQDIASITVLRDGASAAIYGSRGANGVILVTTKGATAGKTSITYDSYVEHDVVAARPDILSPEQYLEKGIGDDEGARTDWYDKLIRKDNVGQNHYLSVSGGDENTVFRLAGNYRSKSGIDIASDRTEYGIRASFQQNAVNNRLELGGNINYRVVDEAYTNYGVFQQAVKLNPTLPVMDPDNPSAFNYLYGFATYNPVQNLKARELGAEQTYSIVNLSAKLNITDHLASTLQVARQGHDELRREYHSSRAIESIDNNRTGRARQENERWTDLTLEWTNQYTNSFERHDFGIMGGYSYQEFNNSGFWAENADFPSDAFGYNNLDAGEWNLEEGRLGMDSWKNKVKVIAFFGRVNYSFDDTYLFTGTLRYEGNTKFGANNKWGLFPSASAAWRLSKLPIIADVAAIDDLKLRASYGVTGRAGFNPYSSLARYQGYGRYLDNEGEWIQVYGPGNNPNRNLRWEKQISYNLGLDFSLFDRVLSGSLDAFIRQGRDVVSNYDTPVPPYLHDQLFTNVASTSARGVELALSSKIIDKDHFGYTIDVAGSYIKSRLDKFSDGTFNKGFLDRYQLPSPGNPGFAQRLEDGVEIGSFYGYKYAGVDDDGNLLVWRDGIVGTEKINAASDSDPNRDRTYLGHGSPRLELSWNNRLTYRSVDLTLFFHGRFNYDILNLYQMYYGLTAEPGVNLLQDAYDRNGHIQSGKVMTDYFLESGNYLKLDNLTLGWTPPLQTKWLARLRLYGTVRNVFTLTKYRGLDPTALDLGREGGLEPGIGDLDVYPITRNYALGAVITF